MLRKLFTCMTILLMSSSVSASGGGQTERIPEGTVLQLSLNDPLSSKLSEPGDEISATLKKDLIVDGLKLLREGTEFIGRVTLAQPARRPFKGGQLHITFDKIRIDGREQKLTAVVQSASDFTRDEKVKGDSEGTLKGGSDGGKTVQNIMTGAGLGGIGATIVILAGAGNNGPAGVRGIGIGRGTTVVGASVVGAGAIAGLLLTKGKEVRLDQNTIVRLKLERPLAID